MTKPIFFEKTADQLWVKFLAAFALYLLSSVLWPDTYIIPALVALCILLPRLFIIWISLGSLVVFFVDPHYLSVLSSSYYRADVALDWAQKAIPELPGTPLFHILRFGARAFALALAVAFVSTRQRFIVRHPFVSALGVLFFFKLFSKFALRHSRPSPSFC